MADATITIPRDRFEAMARQTMAMREQLDALSLLFQSELRAAATAGPSQQACPPGGDCSRMANTRLRKSST